VAVNPTGTDVYVTNGSGTVSVINPANDTVINTIAVGSHPVGVAVDPTGLNAGDI
jgi:YVTN family beta-propeller protein